MHTMMTPKMQALKSGEVIDLEGIRLVRDDGSIGPGDLYVAGRNGDPQLLTCREILYMQNDGSLGPIPDTGTVFGYVYPVDIAYPFNEYECLKVREA